MSDIFFCPEDWQPDEQVSTVVASRVNVCGFNKKRTDAWQIGDWSQHWTAIESAIPMEAGWLESGGSYRFCFWLNGGENANRDEVCCLEIFGDDWEDRLTFRLNREQTKPLLEKNGWLLFAIPFTAPKSADSLHFRFVAARAVCTIAGIPDMDMARCETLVSDGRSFDSPQRHNIVFPGGYPNTPQEKVVLRSNGKEIAVSKRIICTSIAAAAVTCGVALLLHKLAKKKDSETLK